MLHKLRVLTIAVVLTLPASAVAQDTITEPQKSASELASEIQALKAENDALRELLVHRENSLAELSQSLNSADRELAQLQALIVDQQYELSKIQTELGFETCRCLE